tara:strand:- start:1332 stop:1559 length:228 start_codon:yes stop_codon:yes gene_type:complete
LQFTTGLASSVSFAIAFTPFAFGVRGAHLDQKDDSCISEILATLTQWLVWTSAGFVMSASCSLMGLKRYTVAQAF